MRIISLWQPWATLVVMGVKRIETRPRITHIRGTIGIASTKTQPITAVTEPLQEWLRAAYGTDWLRNLPRGKIVGYVDIVDVRPTDQAAFSVTAKEHMLGDYRAGRAAWYLENPYQLKTPVAAKGSQGWWQHDITGAI